MTTRTKTALSIAIALVLAGAAGLALRGPAAPHAASPGLDTPAAAASGASRSAARTSATSAGERDLHLGAQLTYTVSSRRGITDGQGKALLTTTIEGTLTLTVVGADQGGAVVRGELSRASRVDVPAAQASAKELMAPFFFVVAPDGKASGFGFAKAIPGDARRQLRALVSSLELVSGGAAAAWTADETDLTGVYAASYERSGARIVKTKLRYDAIRTPEGLVAPSAAGTRYDVASTATFTVDASGWPAALDERETLNVAFGNGTLANVAQTTAKLVDKGESRAFVGSYEAAKPDFDADVDALAEDSARAKRNADLGLVGGRTFASMTRELETSSDVRVRSRAVARMGALLRTSPEATAEAHRKLLDPKTADATARSLAGALGDAATPEAQRALADAVRSDATSASTKVASVISLGLVAQPGAEARGALGEAARSSDAELASTATLALGSMARRAGDGAADLVSSLLAKLEAAQTPSEKALLLDALGNAGDAKALDAILARTSDPERVVRAAAVSALRFANDERVAPALIGAASVDADLGVRRAALTAMGVQPVAPYVETLAHVLATEGEASLRVLAVRVLARALNQVSEVEAILSKAATKDADARVRDAATEALSRPQPAR